MNNPTASMAVDAHSAALANNAPSASSAVSWGAIFAGAAAAAALSLILLILGTGLGLSSSPWANDGISANGFGVSTILWITFTQVLASGLGGYLAGRLRTRWLRVHADEVYFRDTAHGLLSWCVASLLTAALLSAVIGSILHTGTRAGASVAGGVASIATASAVGSTADIETARGTPGFIGYFVDSLFRKDSRVAATPTASEASGAVPAAEVTGIFMSSLRGGALAPQDRSYVGQLVAARTGLTQQEAEQRVGEIYAAAQDKLRAADIAAREAADQARKLSAYAALWLFISLLVGAFVASFAATRGGQQRDHHP